MDDISLIRQDCSLVSIRFDDDAVAEYFDEQVDAGRRPEQFGRIWLHTHPGDSAAPSDTDEETFQRVFGHCDWAVMFILASGGASYARLRFGVGPGGSMVIPIAVDWSRPVAAADPAAWEAEYRSCVRPQDWFSSGDEWLRESDDPVWREPEHAAYEP